MRTLPVQWYFGFVIAILVIVGAASFWPQSIHFSYGGNNCIFQPTLFPSTFLSSSDTFRLYASQKVSINNFTIASLETCVAPIQSPTPGNNPVALYPAPMPFVKKVLNIVVPSRPVASVQALEKPISTTGSFEVPLTQTDKVFEYVARFNDTLSTKCGAKEKGVVCNVASLNLAHGATYRLAIDRHYNQQKIETIFEQPVTTLLPTRVVGSSIKNGSTVYSKPKSITFSFDKEIMSATVSLTQKGKPAKTISVQHTIKDKKIVVSWKDNLVREKDFTFVLSQVVAIDGSGLVKDYKLAFRTSGGPKVKSISVGAYGVPIGSTIAITFDQPLLASQNLGDSIIAWGGAKVTGMSGAKVFVSLAGVEPCHIVRLSVNDNLVSRYGIKGGSNWQFVTRTICQTVTTIGYSIQGRPINAYWFGSGLKTVVYTGAIHGDESSTYSLMLRWIDSLEASPSMIPNGYRVVVIPAVNPDGLAAGTRTNARNVDLNRNFATNDWKKNITNVYGQSFPGGGGSSPLSEPESKAVANLVASLKPKVVISYHSIGSVVLANPVTGASQLAQRYSAYSGYSYSASSEETFSYSITGTADDYYAQKVGVASIVVELGSHTYHQFELNQTAMQKMLQ